MPSFIVQTLGITIAPEILAILKQELERAGCNAGMLYVGNIKDVPDVAYILWHLEGEMPVSLMIPKAHLASVENIRELADDFITHWNQRLG